LQQAWADFSPADEEEWPDGVERGLAVRAGDEWVGDVEGEGGEAGEDEQPAGWPELLLRGPMQGQVPGTQQQAEDGQVNCRGDQRCDPYGYTQPEREGLIGFSLGSWAARSPFVGCLTW
jgi:hypothetical protein